MKINKIQEDMINLNIGGYHYSTSRITLCSQKNSMLAAMFSGYHKLTMTKDGSYFIDADGKHFDIILNHLRGRIQYATDLPEDKRTLLELRKEADFYNLVVFKDLIDTRLDRYISAGEEWKSNYIKRSSKSNHFATVKDARFRRCEFVDCSFDRITFLHEVDFEYSNLTGATFSNCEFHKQVSFRNAELVRTKFTSCLFKRGVLISFDEANLDGCSFQEKFSTSLPLEKYRNLFVEEIEAKQSKLESLAGNIETMSFCSVRNVDKADFLEGKLEAIKRSSNSKKLF